MGSSKRKKEDDDDEDVSEEGPVKKRKIEDSPPLPEPAPIPVNKPEPSDDGGGMDEMDRLQLLVSAFSNSQQDQYEIYRRSTFPKAAIKKIMQSVAGASVPQNAVIAMAGIAKVYVGELVEEACAAREGEGPLQPKHIREAVRKLKNKDKVPNSRYKKVFPFR
ncbi:transcription initiation factor TFIID subunit 11-like [Halichondria panicea]|uniref:transcription initiation factor TFIID subunit 11-like n=1 Tax=Halichondria panicea TaxID=6063 RepID=UPI00312B4883